MGLAEPVTEPVEEVEPVVAALEKAYVAVSRIAQQTEAWEAGRWTEGLKGLLGAAAGPGQYRPVQSVAQDEEW